MYESNNDPLCVVDTSITISLERYNELIRKELVYEIEKAKSEASTFRTESEIILYSVAETKDEF